jgi:hypothetical protein
LTWEAHGLELYGHLGLIPESELLFRLEEKKAFERFLACENHALLLKLGFEGFLSLLTHVPISFVFGFGQI